MKKQPLPSPSFVFKHSLTKRWPELSILLIALFLYSYQLGTESFWIDEILSVESAQGSLNLNRPLYFILLRGWMHFGQSDLWLRTLSTLFGLGCIGLTYELGRRLVNRQVGLLSAFLLALSPLAIHHAQEVRFYMMSTFLGLAGSLCLSQALKQKVTRSPAALLGWIILRCLGFLTAQPNILLLLPDLLLVAWKALQPSKKLTSHSALSSHPPNRVRLRYWLIGLILLLVPTAIILSDVIPELLEFLSYTTHVASTKPGVANMIGKLAALTVWPLRGPDYDWAIALYPPLFKLYSIVVLGLIAFGSLRAIARYPQLLQATLWGLLPVLSIFIVSQVFPILWQDRYALISAPYVLILLAAVWTQLWNRQKTIAFLLATFYLLAVSGPLLRYYTLDYHADWRGLAQAIALQTQPKDPVLVYPGSLTQMIDYYYEGDDSANFLPMDDVIAAEDLDVNEAIALLQTVPIPNSQFWIVCPVVDQWGEAKNDLIAQLKRSDFELQQERYFLDQWAWGPALYQFSR